MAQKLQINHSQPREYKVHCDPSFFKHVQCKTSTYTMVVKEGHVLNEYHDEIFIPQHRVRKTMFA